MKFFYVGPLPPVYHGQSVAFESLIKSAPSGVVIDTNFKRIGFLAKVLSNFLTIISIVKNGFRMSAGDVVYFTCSRSYLGSLRDIILLIISKLKGCRVVVHLHGADFLTFYENVLPVYRCVLYKSYISVDTFVVLVSPMKNQFSMFPQALIEVVPNFYPACFDNFSNDRKLVSLGDRNVTLVYLSNVLTSKGIFVLLDAFDIVRKIHPSIRLIIAGEILSDYLDDADKVKKMFFEMLGKLDNVQYVGVVSGKDKIDLLVSSDVFVLPTYHKSEAVPLSILEAMAAGCSVITTNHNFLPDIVCKEGAILVEPRDRHSLAEAILTYVSSPELLASHKLANIEFAKVHYSESVYKERLLRILKK